MNERSSCWEILNVFNFRKSSRSIFFVSLNFPAILTQEDKLVLSFVKNSMYFCFCSSSDWLDFWTGAGEGVLVYTTFTYSSSLALRMFSYSAILLSSRRVSSFFFLSSFYSFSNFVVRSSFLVYKSYIFWLLIRSFSLAVFNSFSFCLNRRLTAELFSSKP